MPLGTSFLARYGANLDYPNRTTSFASCQDLTLPFEAVQKPTRQSGSSSGPRSIQAAELSVYNAPQGAIEAQGRSSADNNLLPSVTAPTGVGAIRGMNEAFDVDIASGTASLKIPIPISLCIRWVLLSLYVAKVCDGERVYNYVDNVAVLGKAVPLVKK
ncbi:hypothetical protein B0T26DRAFT_875470 [Lasiosphaeria miniovina]|uniref:Uncharacterized protein n=1 Tax=Lasiosphaeria miniovina TaxID=1954250 RepID=A0AA40DK88_9PEZI|nr:uncharacterized protein B0T26DRAFT_875470 [Lasiosphaeria miniovina]KAK0706250.1 hypothetical protein B0T26DRAFT_875470 [Lasiosphaeria miniovina]